MHYSKWWTEHWQNPYHLVQGKACDKEYVRRKSREGDNVPLCIVYLDNPSYEGII
jgi:hypothetical protein